MAEKAPSNPAGPAPPRRQNSIRRTSTIDTCWPDGIGKPMRMRGRARDLFTAEDGQARVLADDQFDILSSPLREILSIETSRLNDVAQQFVGARGGGHLRGEITRLIPAEQTGATPLNLILDDFSGASLVAAWAWSRWMPDWSQRMRETITGQAVRKMEGICTGFRPGSSSLNPDGTAKLTVSNATVVPPLTRSDDPPAWHEFTVQDSVGMRRARRIDAWLEDGLVRLDIGFQDSASSPEGGPDRIAVHEYQVSATADPETFELKSIAVDPRILPFAECPDASLNAQKMVGSALNEFRLKTPEILPGILGCTHLNDVLRSMNDAPQLARRLQRELVAIA
jgi:hypothetical protein